MVSGFPALPSGGVLRLRVFTLGLACCAVESSLAALPRPRPGDDGHVFVSDPQQAEVLVVSGTVTDKLAPAVRRTYEAMLAPRYVVCFGACASSGGPYWDSYCVSKGADLLVPVDLYVPGCPPRPQALLAGLDELAARIAGGVG